MKQKIKLTESSLKRMIKESVKKVLNEDYDYKSDFEDGGNLYDRETYGMNDDEVSNWQREEVLADKKYKNDNYEALRKEKIYDKGGYFRANMENKLLKDHPEYEKLMNDDYQDISSALETILRNFHILRMGMNSQVKMFKSAYDETGDERYLIAIKNILTDYDRQVDKLNSNLMFNNNPIKFRIQFQTNILNDYSPLSKDKVYHSDTESGTHSNRLANVKDRKKGVNGHFYS